MLSVLGCFQGTGSDTFSGDPVPASYHAGHRVPPSRPSLPQVLCFPLGRSPAGAAGLLLAGTSFLCTYPRCRPSNPRAGVRAAPQWLLQEQESSSGDRPFMKSRSDIFLISLTTVAPLAEVSDVILPIFLVATGVRPGTSLTHPFSCLSSVRI